MSESPDEKTTPAFVLSHEGELLGEDTPENRELVRRIQVCVHACDGISTVELERGIVADMRRVLENVAPLLQAQNEVLRSHRQARAAVLPRADSTPSEPPAPSSEADVDSTSDEADAA